MIDYDELILETKSKILVVSNDLKYFEDLYIHNYILFMKSGNKNGRYLYYENYRFFYDIYLDIRDKLQVLKSRLCRFIDL